jgi:DnaA family protein
VPEQLPLQFELQSNQSFSTFYPGNNQETVSHLQKIYSSNEQQIFLWGDSGTGKTHCLQASCQEANKHNKTSFYLSINPETIPDPSILEGLETFDLVCFDNIEHISKNTEWEQGFFNFFNLHRDNNKQLIISASCPPKYLDIQLPDLKTRMNWGLTLKLTSLTDEQQLNALIYKANTLGFDIPNNVGRFIMTHYARDLTSIWAILDKIEQATLVAKRKITIPFLKQIMAKRK